jgi:outer membrane cobalamin receptor
MQQSRHSRAIVAIITAGVAVSHVQAAAIEEIVVSGGRIEETIPQELARYGNQVEVITAEQIRKTGFVDVAQTLQMLVPGLNIRPKNGPFDYLDASLQGSRSGDILWLIDGVRINNRLYNGTMPLDTLPAHMIERIEVLKGGQGIFYGTQSVGGVINVVTKSLQTNEDGAVSANVNTNSGRGLNGYFRGGNDQVQFAVYASKDEADGYAPWRDRDIQASAADRERGYDVAMAGVKLGFQPSENSLLSLHYQRTEADLDFLRPFATVQGLNEREEDIFTLKYELQVNDALGLFVKAYRHEWVTHHTDIRNIVAGGLVTGNLRTVSNAAFWGYDDEGVNAMAKMDFGHGLEYIIGFDRQQFSGSDDVWRIANLKETVNAGFVQVRTTEDLFDNTMLAVGARQNRPDNSDAKTVWNISGRHDFNESLYVQANIGTSFRLPDAEMLFLNEIYDEDNDGVPDDGYFAVGNPNLKPEQSENINISIGGTVGILRYELTGFQRDISDFIVSYTPIVIAGVEGESFANTNDEVEMEGFELSLSLPLGEHISARFSYTDTSAEMNGNGTQLQGIPENETKLHLDWLASSQAWGASLALNHVGNFTSRAQQRGNYTVVDLAGHLAFGSEREHRVVVRAENLTDKVYATGVGSGTRDAGGTYLYDNLGMERTFHASYTYSF